MSAGPIFPNNYCFRSAHICLLLRICKVVVVRLNLRNSGPSAQSTDSEKHRSNTNYDANTHA
jgi:hypothetical protein